LVINISKDQINLIERGVYHFGLSRYPNITKLELHKIIAFMRYEKSYGRETDIMCDDDDVLSTIKSAVDQVDTNEIILPLIENNFIYHATDLSSAMKILSDGRLLSAVKVYGKSSDELADEKSNSLWNDPADYFEYIMFCWGDNMTGDYVVLSDNFPSEDDIIKGNYNPGVRFYFCYDQIIKHPGHVFDGYHSIKIRDSIELIDYLFACIVPDQFKNELQHCVSPKMTDKIYYINQSSLGLSEWNDKVYNFVNSL